MGGRVSKDTDHGDTPMIVKRGREDAIAWARGLVAKGIRVIRLRSRKPAAAPKREPALIEPRR